MDQPTEQSCEPSLEEQSVKDVRMRQLDFLTKHFLVLSAFLLGISSALSMLFLVSYLAVFDWTLVWLIEYADLAKLFLLGAALILAMLVVGSTYIQNFIALKGIDGKAKFVFGFFIVAFVAWTLLQPIYEDIKKGIYFPQYHLYRAFSIVSLGYFVFGSRFILANWKKRLKNEIMSDLLFISISISVCGLTFGYFVRDESYDKREIFTKEASYPDSKIILSFSHHLAILSHDKIVILPTSDVIKIVTQVPPKPEDKTK